MRMGLLPIVPDAIARAESARSSPGKTGDVPSWEVWRCHCLHHHHHHQQQQQHHQQQQQQWL